MSDRLLSRPLGHPRSLPETNLDELLATVPG